MPLDCHGGDDVIAIALSLSFEAMMLLELVNWFEITGVPVLDNCCFASDPLVV